LDQTKYIAEKQDHDYVKLEVVKLLSSVCALCEEEGHAIMDHPFVPFHIKMGVAKHVELYNAIKSLKINHRNKN
jgi:hypothetical protein